MEGTGKPWLDIKEIKMEFLKKLKSRKFIAALAGFAMGAAMIFGVSAGEMQEILGAAISVASLISYIVVEGKIDVEALCRTAQAVEKAVEEVNADDK